MPSEEAIYLALSFPILIILAIRCIDFFRRWSKSTLLTEWPVVGMLPGLCRNVHRIHQFATETVEESGGTLWFKGPWLANMDMLVTADPANVHYILTKNFANFGKGPEFKKIFEILGEGIFAAEAESWENQRKAAKLFMMNNSFQQFVAETTWRKVETALFPVFDSAAETGDTKNIDAQQIFQRFGFDCTVLMIFGHDPRSLSNEMHDLPEVKAFHDAEEAVFVRHIVPEGIWKLQKYLQIGMEKKMTEATDIIHSFVAKCVGLKEQKFRLQPGSENDYDMFACYRRAISEKHESVKISEEVWKDATLNFLIAGKDSISTTLSWFFWLLANNRDKEEKLRREIAAHFPIGKWRFTGLDELKNLVYLHGAICETLRLFPPIALNHKAPLESDTLPSGHRVEPNSKIVISFYSMGRMESIWGKDCLEFKPERWISERGTNITVPSFKFPAFNAGPRTCLGKEIALIQLKIAAAAIVSRFKIDVVDGHSVTPSASVILHMKNGMKVKIQRYE